MAVSTAGPILAAGTRRQRKPSRPHLNGLAKQSLNVFNTSMVPKKHDQQLGKRCVCVCKSGNHPTWLVSFWVPLKAASERGTLKKRHTQMALHPGPLPPPARHICGALQRWPHWARGRLRRAAAPEANAESQRLVLLQGLELKLRGHQAFRRYNES